MNNNNIHIINRFEKIDLVQSGLAALATHDVLGFFISAEKYVLQEDTDPTSLNVYLKEICSKGLIEKINGLDCHNNLDLFYKELTAMIIRYVNKNKDITKLIKSDLIEIALKYLSYGINFELSKNCDVTILNLLRALSAINFSKTVLIIVDESVLTPASSQDKIDLFYFKEAMLETINQKNYKNIVFYLENFKNIDFHDHWLCRKLVNLDSSFVIDTVFKYKLNPYLIGKNDSLFLKSFSENYELFIYFTKKMIECNKFQETEVEYLINKLEDIEINYNVENSLIFLMQNKLINSVQFKNLCKHIFKSKNICYIKNVSFLGSIYESDQFDPNVYSLNKTHLIFGLIAEAFRYEKSTCEYSNILNIIEYSLKRYRAKLLSCKGHFLNLLLVGLERDYKTSNAYKDELLIGVAKEVRVLMNNPDENNQYPLDIAKHTEGITILLKYGAFKKSDVSFFGKIKSIFYINDPNIKNSLKTDKMLQLTIRIEDSFNDIGLKLCSIKNIIALGLIKNISIKKSEFIEKINLTKIEYNENIYNIEKYLTDYLPDTVDLYLTNLALDEKENFNNEAIFLKQLNFILNKIDSELKETFNNHQKNSIIKQAILTKILENKD